MSGSKRYEFDIPGLAEKVGGLDVDPKHAGLLKLLRRDDALTDCQLVTTRGDARLQRRRVLTRAGDVVADDHEAWLAKELAVDGGRVRATASRLRPLDYTLTEIGIEDLYLVHDRGGPQDNYLQLVIAVETERIERRLFASSAWGEYFGDGELYNLVNVAEGGERVAEADRAVVGQPRYRLRRIVDMAAFVKEATAHVANERDQRGAQRLLVRTDGGPEVPMTLDEMTGHKKGSFVWQGQRMFDDWSRSSAGLEGHRICESWAMDLSDYTSPQGERSMGLIPLWAHTMKIAVIERRPKSDIELFGKLESLDRRLGVPFAWYFYMLHGNLVRDWVGDVILKTAEKGLIVLPEHDYRVLKCWSASPYGF